MYLPAAAPICRMARRLLIRQGMRYSNDTSAIEALRSFAEFQGKKPFVLLCGAALRGEKWAKARIEDALLDFCFAPCGESHLMEIVSKTDCARLDGGCLRCGRSDGSHVGYHEDDELPIRRGDRVRIRSGAEIWTSHSDPARQRFQCSRARVVTVHSMDPGQTVSVSLYGDAEHKRRLRELEWMIPKEDDAAKRQLMRLEAADLERGMLHSQHPGVCWVGTGGYWHHAALSAVELVTAHED
jgi:hypothetical protein